MCINFLLKEYIGSTNLLITQLVPVLVSAFFFRRTVSLFTACMSILIFDFLFVKPYYTFTISDWEYFIAFIGYVAIALIISNLATRLSRLMPQIVLQSEDEIGATSRLSSKFIKAKTQKDVFRTLANEMHNYGSGNFAIFMYDHMGVHIEAGDSEYPVNEEEKNIVIWVYNNGQAAGYRTDSFTAVKEYYIPLKINKKIFGVMAFAFDKPEEALVSQNKEIFETMAFLGALALERL